ncbi:hypothetical protein caldi_00960 [Caldinitratiruptor microaerophilus]|uniref:Pyridoxal-phosphate dependent enzyme n=1 Tax=Caldinitratiruptor microaerophilus TaxID=671077 RepID=A0AA35CKI4_9FIRM|nr:hypothetical protein [Caldinitratiruptor microaerophilus]BDG59006.1 hypothetical protein caldi_00960 [Caldinitratiruptor microaerophilus]
MSNSGGQHLSRLRGGSALDRDLLPESEIPQAWYNIQADMPRRPAPPLHPATKKPVGPDDLVPIFPMALAEQEVSTERWIPIPEAVREDFAPPGIHAGGLRFHGAAPLVSQLVEDGIVEARAYGQLSVFEAAVLFARSEGILPAPESAHAVKAAVDEALQAKEAGEPRVILFGLSGHGHFDMVAYDAYLHGRLEDFDYPGEAIEESLRAIAPLQP